MICEKKLSVPFKAKIGGGILDVCNDCLKYGKKTDIIEVERITLHTPIISIIEIGKD
jgi:ribosome-binding protein aMBF1 (putative translation factor)